jgi:hypothetical protein
MPLKNHPKFPSNEIVCAPQRVKLAYRKENVSIYELNSSALKTMQNFIHRVEFATS